jgi:predicted NUDIX family phosphoesterase
MSNEGLVPLQDMVFLLDKVSAAREKRGGQESSAESSKQFIPHGVVEVGFSAN